MKAVYKIASVVCCIGLGALANGLFGNTISSKLANQCAIQYVENNYPDMDLEVSKVFYNCEMRKYSALVQSTTSRDTQFYLAIDRLGQLSADYYQISLIEKYSTWDRISDDYRNTVATVLESKEFTDASNMKFGYLEERYETEKAIGENFGIDRETLILDKDYDIREMGSIAGHIVLDIEDDDVSIERAARMLLDIKGTFDDAKVTFYAIDLFLHEPANEDKISSEDMFLEIREFLYQDIYEEGLIERLFVQVKELAELN